MKYECHTDRFMRKLCFIYKKTTKNIYINDVEKERKEKKEKKEKKRN